jgi:hypothetical protein
VRLEGDRVFRDPIAASEIPTGQARPRRTTQS